MLINVNRYSGFIVEHLAYLSLCCNAYYPFIVNVGGDHVHDVFYFHYTENVMNTFDVQ